MKFNIKIIAHTLIAFVLIITIGDVFAEYNKFNQTPKKVFPVETQNNLYKKLQSLIERERNKYNLTGLSVSISLPDSPNILNFTSGTTTLKGTKSITPNTPFQIGSITKTYIATLTLILDDKDIISIHDKVGKWLPGYPHWNDITIEQLLNHTSGIQEVGHAIGFWKDVAKNPRNQKSLKELANLTYELPPAFKSGTAEGYSNSDYVVLGLIIEKATKKTIKENLSDYLTGNALNTPYTQYFSGAYPNNIKKIIAHGYNNEGTFPKNTDVTNVTAANFGPASDMVSTPNNMIKFLRLLFSDNILSNTQLAKMLSLVSDEDASSVNKITKPTLEKGYKSIGSGLGIGLVYGKNIGFEWMHSGGRLGYESLFAYNPCKNIYVALAYNTRPQEELTFLSILEDITKMLNKSHIASNQTQSYMMHHALPDFCERE